MDSSLAEESSAAESVMGIWNRRFLCEKAGWGKLVDDFRRRFVRVFAEIQRIRGRSRLFTDGPGYLGTIQWSDLERSSKLYLSA